VDEAGGVEVKEGFCHLIEDVFSVSFGEDVFADECEEVDVHVFEDEIDISVILGADHLLQFDYIGMGQFHQEHYLAIGPLCVGGVIECVKIFLECFDLSGFFIGHLPIFLWMSKRARMCVYTYSLINIIYIPKK
jgi:hypothetical protein